jgi:hypothetical protein
MASKYKYTGDGGVQDVERGAFIPNDPANRDWQEYLLYDGTTDPQYTPAEEEEIAWNELRGQRDNLLRATDFMMTTDFYASMTSQEQSDVTAYRQDLRDLPDDTSDPYNPVWPTKPQIVIDQGI